MTEEFRAHRLLLESKTKEIISCIIEKSSDTVSTWQQVEHESKVEHSMSFWSVDSISNGSLPTALMLDQASRVFPSLEVDQLIHQHISTAIDNLLNPQLPHRYSVGLHSGLAGFCYVVHICSRGGQKYSRLMEQLDDLFLERLAEKIDTLLIGGPTPWLSFDVISGSAGILRYLVERADNPRMVPIRDTLVDDLVRRANTPMSMNGFFVSAEDLPSDDHRKRFPLGCVDLGFAHGIAGALASLSLCKRYGVQHPDLESSIRQLVFALKEHRLWRGGSPAWSSGVGPSSRFNELPAQLAWCYGAPGVVLSILHAGVALDDSEIVAYGLESMRGVYADDVGVRHIMADPCLCHGCSGLLSLSRVFSQFAPELAVSELSDRLASHLLSLWDDEHQLFQLENRERLFPYFSFLDGGLGAACSLISILSPIPMEWEELFLFH